MSYIIIILDYHKIYELGKNCNILTTFIVKLVMFSGGVNHTHVSEPHHSA